MKLRLSQSDIKFEGSSSLEGSVWNGTMWCGTTRFFDPHTAHAGNAARCSLLKDFQADDLGAERPVKDGFKRLFRNFSI